MANELLEAPGILVGSFNFKGMLSILTDTPEEEWTEVDGPDSRCGLDYWYKNLVTEDDVWINVDQGFIEVYLNEDLIADSDSHGDLFDKFTQHA